MPRFSSRPRTTASPLNNRQFLSPSEVAIILGVSRKLVMIWIEQGRLPAFRPGPENRLTRIRRQDLERFVEQHMRGAEVTASDSAPDRTARSE